MVGGEPDEGGGAERKRKGAGGVGRVVGLNGERQELAGRVVIMRGHSQLAKTRVY